MAIAAQLLGLGVGGEIRGGRLVAPESGLTVDFKRCSISLMKGVRLEARAGWRAHNCWASWSTLEAKVMISLWKDAVLATSTDTDSWRLGDGAEGGVGAGVGVVESLAGGTATLASFLLGETAGRVSFWWDVTAGRVMTPSLLSESEDSAGRLLGVLTEGVGVAGVEALSEGECDDRISAARLFLALVEEVVRHEHVI